VPTSRHEGREERIAVLQLGLAAVVNPAEGMVGAAALPPPVRGPIGTGQQQQQYSSAPSYHRESKNAIFNNNGVSQRRISSTIEGQKV